MHIDSFFVLFILFTGSSELAVSYQIFDNFRKDDEKFLFLKIHFYCVFSFVNLKMFLSNPLVTIFYLLLYIKSDKGLNMNSVDLR